MKSLSVFSSGADRAVIMTVAPPRWKRSAIALPAPFVPPVTKTRLPLNSFVAFIVCFRTQSSRSPRQKIRRNDCARRLRRRTVDGKRGHIPADSTWHCDDGPQERRLVQL